MEASFGNRRRQGCLSGRDTRSGRWAHSSRARVLPPHRLGYVEVTVTSAQSHATRREGPIYMTVSDMERLMALVKGCRLQGREDGNLNVLEEELDRALV